jgi:hypothetical protein
MAMIDLGMEKILKNTLVVCSFTFALSVASTFAKDCPDEANKYGDGQHYQDIFCKIKVSAGFKTSSDVATLIDRSMTFTDTGLLQVFNGFAGTKTSNSTSTRVYYLFPLRTEKKITAIDGNHLSLTHPSGVQFDFDKNGNPTSSDIKMKVNPEINSKNNGGVEIESYPKGIVVDAGYRIGESPIINPEAKVTITDKNLKKCTLKNSEYNKITGSKKLGFEAQLIYKTNGELHKFLAKRCPTLDISDLLDPVNADLKAITKPQGLGAAPAHDITLESASTHLPKADSRTDDNAGQAQAASAQGK